MWYVKKMLLPMLFLITSCNVPATQHKPVSIFESVAAFHPQAKNHLVFAFNPNDCLNCLYVFSEHLAKWRNNPANGLILVLQEVREVERKDILRKSLAGIDSNHIQIIWDSNLYTRIQEAGAHNKLNTSVLEVYSASGEKLFRKEVRNISGAEPELQRLLVP
jgi:hypothetical protein